MTDTAMITLEIPVALKWELLTLIGDRLRQLDERIVYDRHRGTNGTGAELAYERLRRLSVEIGRKHCGADMVRGDADVIARARQAARQAKDWAEADRLRGLLIEGGWHVTDTTTGYELTQARHGRDH